MARKEDWLIAKESVLLASIPEDLVETIERHDLVSVQHFGGQDLRDLRVDLVGRREDERQLQLIGQRLADVPLREQSERDQDVGQRIA